MSMSRLQTARVPFWLRYKNGLPPQFSVFYRRNISAQSTDLKGILAEKIKSKQQRISDFRKKCGSIEIGKLTVDMIFGGMRGLACLLSETSNLNPEEGIFFRGHSIPQIRKLLPKAPGGEEPLPEGQFWLLITGDIPTEEQVKAVSKAWAMQADLPQHLVTMIHNFPANMHPMAQLSSAITACSTESYFSRAYQKGVSKSIYWEYIFDDAVALIAKFPTITSIIYRNIYREASPICAIDSNKDWSANFCSMLGYDDPTFHELIRLYMTIQSDHEGGSVPAHATHLVSSALSDPYLSFSAGLNALAGPIQGLANKEVITWLTKLQEQLGGKIKKDDLKAYVWKTLKAEQAIPGYGHSVLRKTDPRFICLRDFALKHLPDNQLFKLASALYEVVPPILLEVGKMKNPWPNVEALSGVVLHHYGMKEINYYTVLFGMSRALGVLSSLVWHRALGLPIERPKSITTDALMELAGYK